MSDTKIVVEPTRERPASPSETLEERILAAAKHWSSEISTAIEGDVNRTLEEGYRDLLMRTLGIRADWGRVEFVANHTNALSKDFQSRAIENARTLLASIDFSTVTLTDKEVALIKAEYKRELMRGVNLAVHNLAQQRIEKFARQVLEVPDDD